MGVIKFQCCLPEEVNEKLEIIKKKFYRDNRSGVIADAVDDYHSKIKEHLDEGLTRAEMRIIAKMKGRDQ